MSAMRLAIAGAAGRMGRALVQTIHEHPDCEVAGALETPSSPMIGHDAGELAGVGNLNLPITDDLLGLALDIDGVIDFTIPASSVTIGEVCAQARIVHVIGTTGFNEEQETALKACARHARIVKSGNMSLGVNLLTSLVRKVAAALDDDFDIEVLEMHHRHKIDAPSGTALMLGEAAAEGRGIDFKSNAVLSREGHTGAREKGTVGFATLRGGSVIGDHSVIFAGGDERIVLEHRAQSREIYANGALKAALWAFDKDPGLYNMDDVLGIS